MEDLKKIRAHFDAYPLQTTKLVHYLLWCNVMDQMLAKNHTTLEGINAIVSIKSMFPTGLNDKLKNLVNGLN